MAVLIILALRSDPALDIIRNNALRGMTVTGDAIFKVAKKLILSKQNKEKTSSISESQKEIKELRDKIQQQDEDRLNSLIENKGLKRAYDKLVERMTKLREELEVQIQQYNEICKHNMYLQEKSKGHNVAPYEIHVDLEEEIEVLKQNELKILRAKEEAERQLDKALRDLDYVKQSMDTIREMVLPENPNASPDDIEKEIEKQLKTSVDIIELDTVQKRTKQLLREERRLNNLVAETRRELHSTEFELRNVQLLQRRNGIRRSLNPVFVSSTRPSPRRPISSLEPRPPPGRRIASALSMLPSTPLPGITVSPTDAPKAESQAGLAVANSIIRVPSSLSSRSGTATMMVFCILCRKKVRMNEGPACYIHRNACVEGIWSCCKNRKDGKGCYAMKHCYLKKNSIDRDMISTIDHVQQMYFSSP